jgi:ubiquinone/menaquinone biosynthesis C-methylase UbiE
VSAEAQAGTAFNAIAAEYDRVFTDTLIGRAQRRAVWEMADRVFQPGQQILEINCGTGFDALHFAQRGVRVHACDASSAMVEIARGRARQAGTTVEIERRAIEELGQLRGAYDGVFSNFGGLNCVADLSGFASVSRELIRPGGSAVLCYMGPFCAWETLWYLARLQPRKAARRWTRHTVRARIGHGQEFRIRYPGVRHLATELAPDFRLMSWRGVGIVVPPSYAERFAASHERSLKVAARIDRVVGGWPFFRGMGDHVLLHFQRVDR